MRVGYLTDVTYENVAVDTVSQASPSPAAAGRRRSPTRAASSASICHAARRRPAVGRLPAAIDEAPIQDRRRARIRTSSPAGDEPASLRLRRRFRVADEPGLERHAHDFAQGQKFLGQFGNDTVTLSKMKAGGSTMWR
ncbi:MAG: hypothetical protein R2856_35140 [Caldilineaceae bacterium]